MDETRTGNATGKLIVSLLSFLAIGAGGVVGYLVGSLFGWYIDLSYTVGEAIVAVLAILALGGGAWLRFDRDAIVESWRFMWWIIVISAVLMVWDLFDYIMAGEVVQHGWLLRCLSSLVLCLAIGVSEEGMFRGALFGGLLARFGGKKNGVLWCVALSSLAFGCAHVTADDFDFNNWLTVVQALLKICQTGIYAIMLCAVVLKTKNLVGAMMVHAIDDYLLFVVSTGLFGEVFETEYVTAETDEAISSIIFYLIIIALYLPTFIKAVRELMKMQAPQRGPFVRELDEVAQPALGWQNEQAIQPQQPYGQSFEWQYAQGNQQPYELQQPQQQNMAQPYQQPYVQQPYTQQSYGQPPYAEQPFGQSYQQAYGQPYAQPYQQPTPKRPPRPDGLA